MTISPRIKSYFSSIYLAVEWRVIATALTFLAAFIVSRDLTISLEIASIEVVMKIVVQSFWIKHRVKNGA